MDLNKNTNNDCVKLRTLLDVLQREYLESAVERKLLHQVEWGTKTANSILGEVEVQADDVIGIASSALARTLTAARAVELVTALKSTPSPNADFVSDWTADMQNQKEFPKFLHYINSIQTLRTEALAFLESIVAHNKNGAAS